MNSSFPSRLSSELSVLTDDRGGLVAGGVCDDNHFHLWMILAQGAVDAAPEKPRIVVVGDDDRNENPVGCRMSHGTPRAAFMGMDTAPHRRTQETGASARCSARAPLSPRRTQRKKIMIKKRSEEHTSELPSPMRTSYPV